MPDAEALATTPQLTVIIPTLNEANIITASLDRLDGWRRAGAEIIVVDGGSSDGTCALATSRADRVISTAAGRARQMNAGAASARSPVLLFLHADTQLPPDAMPAVLKAVEARAWGRFDVRIRGHSPMLPIVAACMNLRSRLTGIATGDQALFMQRATFVDLGGFPEQPLMEDIEMSRRLKRSSRPACLRLKATTDGRRWERRGIAATIWLMWRLRFRYWRGASAVDLAKEYHHVR